MERAELEQCAREVWKSALSVERVDDDDDFFGLGGHSLIVLEVVSAIEETTGVVVEVDDLLAAPLFSDFVDWLAGAKVEEESWAGERKVTPIATADSYSLSSEQLEVWLAQMAAPQACVFNMPGVFSVEPTVDPDRLAVAVGALGRRHDVLRTSFLTMDGEPRQVLQGHARLALEVLSFPGGEAGEGAAQEAFACMAATPFDLRSAPLARMVLACLEDGRQLFFILLHHLIYDGWSERILMADLLELYQSDGKGEGATLQYRDFGRRDVRKQDRAFWQQALQSPLGRVDVGSTSSATAGCHAMARLGKTLSASVKAFAASQQAPVFPVLLTPFVAMVSRWASSERFAIGMGSSGRVQKESWGVIGTFARVLPIVVDSGPEDSSLSLFQQLHRRVAGGLTAQTLSATDLRHLLVQAGGEGAYPITVGMTLHSHQFLGRGAERDTKSSPFHPRVVLPLGDTHRDLWLLVVEEQGDYVVYLHGRRACWSPKELAEVGEEYVELTRFMLATPTAPLRSALAERSGVAVEFDAALLNLDVGAV